MHTLRPLALIFLITGLCFGVTWSGAFLNFDDLRHIPENPFLRAGDVAHFWREPYFYLYAPVVYTVWTAAWRISAGPAIFHLLNILLHAGNAGLVFLIVRRLGFRSLEALFASLLFVLYPVQLEAVAWISAGRDQLSAFFGLLAVYLFVARDRAGWWAVASVAFALGVLSKPGLVALPVAILCLNKNYIHERRRTWWLGGWLLLALGVCWLTTQTQNGITDLRLPEVHVFARVLVAVDALGFYVRKILWPFALSADYARTPQFVLESYAYLWGALTLVIAGGAAWLARRHLKVQGFLFLGFALMTLLPVLGFVPFIGQIQSTVADRYLYLPMLGICLAALSGSRLIRDARVRVGIASSVLALAAGRTISHASVWHDNRALFTAIAAAEPRSYLGAVNLANEEVKARRWDHAAELLRRARGLHPELATAPAGLAQVYWMTGQRDRVLREIAPLLDQIDFVERNAASTLDLSVMYLMVARARAALGELPTAHAAYCTYVKLNPAGEASDELKAFRRVDPKPCL